MRLKTIWTIKMMTLPERLRRTRDWATAELAVHLPLRLRYWVTIHELAKITTQKLPERAVPDITLSEILENLDSPKNLS